MCLMVNAKVLIMSVMRFWFFYSTQQLAWKKITLSLLSWPNSMPILQGRSMTSRLWMTYSTWEELSMVYNWSRIPKRWYMGSASKSHYFYMGDPPTLAKVHNGVPILHVWDKLHEEQNMYTNTMFAVIDILVAVFEGLDLKDIYARRQVSYRCRLQRTFILRLVWK